jgi:hypothetical protein
MAGLELTLEVRAPQIVGREDRAGRLARVSNATTAAFLGHHAMAAQDVAHGGAVRQIPVAVTLVHQGQKLLATPGRVMAPCLEERGDNLISSAVR